MSGRPPAMNFSDSFDFSDIQLQNPEIENYLPFSRKFPPKNANTIKSEWPEEQSQKRPMCYPKRPPRQQRIEEDVPEDMLDDLLSNDQNVPKFELQEALREAYEVAKRQVNEIPKKTPETYRFPPPQVQQQRAEACTRNYPHQAPARSGSVPVQRAPPQISNDNCQRIPTNNSAMAACPRNTRNQTDSDMTPDVGTFSNVADFIRREQARKAQAAERATETSSPNEEDDALEPTYSDFVKHHSLPSCIRNPPSRGSGRNPPSHGSDRETVGYQGFPKGVKPSDRRMREFAQKDEELLRTVRQHVQDVQKQLATSRLKAAAPQARARSCPAPDERSAQRAPIQRSQNAAQNVCAAPSKSTSDVRRPEGAQPGGLARVPDGRNLERRFQNAVQKACARPTADVRRPERSQAAARVPEDRNQDRERPTNACPRRDNLRPTPQRHDINEEDIFLSENHSFVTSTPVSDMSEIMSGVRERPNNTGACRRNILPSPPRRIINEMETQESSSSEMQQFVSSTPLPGACERITGFRAPRDPNENIRQERTPETLRIPPRDFGRHLKENTEQQDFPAYCSPSAGPQYQGEIRSFPSQGQSSDASRDPSPGPRRAAPAYQQSMAAPQGPDANFYQATDRHGRRPEQAYASRVPDEGIQQAACARQGQPGAPLRAASRVPDEGIQQAACARQGQPGSPLRAASRVPDEGIQQAACARQGQPGAPLRAASPAPRSAAPAYQQSMAASRGPDEGIQQAACARQGQPGSRLRGESPGQQAAAPAYQQSMAASRGPDEPIQQAACARQGGQPFAPFRDGSPGPRSAAPAYQQSMGAPRGQDEDIQQAACARKGQQYVAPRDGSPGPRSAAPAYQQSMGAPRGQDEDIQQAACARPPFRDASPGPRSAAPAYQQSMGAPRGPDEGIQQAACARQVQPGSPFRAASPGPRPVAPAFQSSAAASRGPDEGIQQAACARKGQQYVAPRDASPGRRNSAPTFPAFAGASRGPDENSYQTTGMNYLRPEQSCPSSRDPSPGQPRTPLGTSSSLDVPAQARHLDPGAFNTFGSSNTGFTASRPSFEFPLDEIDLGVYPEFKAFVPPSNQCSCQRDVDMNKNLDELPGGLPESLSDEGLAADQAAACPRGDEPQAGEQPKASLFRCLAQKLSNTYEFISALVAPQRSTDDIRAQAVRPNENSDSVRECKNAKRCGRVQFDENAEEDARDTRLAAIRKSEIENLVKDTYCPGLIQETVDGNQNFNRRSFTISFGEEWKEQSNRGGPPNEDPMTLLEAFSKRLDLDKEQISKNLKQDATEEHIDDLIYDYFASQNPSDLNRAIKCFFLSERLQHTELAEQDKGTLDADVQRWATGFPNKPNEEMIAYTGHTKPTPVI